MANKDVEMFYKQAMAFLGQDELDKSLEMLDMVLSIDKKYIPAWNNKGVILLEREEYPQALECFEQVITLDPGDYMAWYNKGYVHLLLEDYQDCVNTFEFFLARYPEKGDFRIFGLYLQAKGYYGLKENEKAKELLEKALKIDKTFKEARELLLAVSTEINK